MDAVKQGNNKYCGPAVLSIITGKSTDECASILAKIQNRIDVREVSISDMKEACKKLRYSMDLVELTENSSLFFTFHRLYNQAGLYMLFVKKHVVAIEVTSDKQIFICDNHTKEPINASNSSRLGQKCLGVYRVTAKAPIELLSETIEVKRISYGLNIYKTKLYSDPEDNITMHLGYLTITEDSDLDNIRKALMHFGKW